MKKNKGFTLVEIIVILVILAILAAVLIPSLTHYIDKAKEKQITSDARGALMATQTLLSENYAKYGNVQIVTLTTAASGGSDEKVGIQAYSGKDYASATDKAEFDNDDIRELAEIDKSRGYVSKVVLAETDGTSCEIVTFEYYDYSTKKTASHNATSGIWTVS